MLPPNFSLGLFSNRSGSVFNCYGGSLLSYHIHLAKQPTRGAWNRSYAQTWEEAMVSGNGKQGVMVFGNPSKETIIGNHSRLYLPHGTNQPLPNMAPHVEKVREIIAEEG